MKSRNGIPELYASAEAPKSDCEELIRALNVAKHGMVMMFRQRKNGVN